MVEVDDARTVGVGGNPQIRRMADVSAKLELVVAQHLGPVVDELSALFLLGERAVAAADAKTLADTIVASVFLTNRLVKDKSGQTVGGGIGSVQTRESQVRCRGAVVLIELGGVRIVSEPSEPEVRQQAAAEGVIESGCQAVVLDQGIACQGHCHSRPGPPISVPNKQI